MIRVGIILIIAGPCIMFGSFAISFIISGIITGVING